MGLSKKAIIIQVPSDVADLAQAPIKTTADASNYVLMLDDENNIFRITKANLLAGLSSGSSDSGSGSSSGTTPTPDGTFIHLLLNETSGTTANDTSGNSKNASYVSCLLNANGAILDGVSSRISLNAPQDALTSYSVGIEFKTNANTLQGLWEFRASQDLSSGTFTPSLLMNSAGTLYVYGYPSGSPATSNSFNDNTWHKAIALLSNSSIKLYVDKVKVLDVAANPITSFSGFFTIGATKKDGASIFNGQVKNFRIWDHLLSESEAIAAS
ncbi:LamG-like jellyroll fold domain-containing protein [Nostoc sp.]|uniref:LamG-like jellyroll fold domain-containing protein n=1 Tax=Nostoc sp. TaxID=1180 RepID=UPI002FF97AC9